MKTLVADDDFPEPFVPRTEVPEDWNTRWTDALLEGESCYKVHPQWVVRTPSGVNVCVSCDTDESVESWPELSEKLLGVD